jgi:hypothetical protein
MELDERSMYCICLHTNGFGQLFAILQAENMQLTKAAMQFPVKQFESNATNAMMMPCCARCLMSKFFYHSSGPWGFMAKQYQCLAQWQGRSWLVGICT